MYKEIPYDKYMKEVNGYLSSGGVFLTAGSGEKINTMTIGWGGITFFWGKPIFLVPVRRSRHTYNFMEASDHFTVSVPLGKDMKKELAFCGSKSGRDYDKFKECGLTPVKGQKVDTPIIGECTLHYECRIVYKQEMSPEFLNKEIDDRFYPDYHTFYYGEIVSCYINE